MARNRDMSKRSSTGSMQGLNRLNPSNNTDKKSLDGIQNLRPQQQSGGSSGQGGSQGSGGKK